MKSLTRLILAAVERKGILLEPTLTKSSRKKFRIVNVQKKFRKFFFKPLTASKLNLSTELNIYAQI